MTQSDRDLEVIECPFCRDSGTAVLFQDGWEARRCRICRLVFVSPRPTPEAVAGIYRNGQTHNRPERHLAKSGSLAVRADARLALCHIAKNCETGRLLEVGPGGGTFLVEARRAGWDVAGVELNPRQAAFIRDELGIECVETLHELIDLGHFDAVYHKDVLSHLTDPVETFLLLREVLRPGGIMVFETGNGDYDLKYATLIKSFEFPDHLFFFSEPALDNLLAASGFVLIDRLRYGTTVQLRLDRTIRQVLRRSANGVSGGTSSGGRIWEALELARHALRYRLGRFLPTRDRPFTMITIARSNAVAENEPASK